MIFDPFESRLCRDVRNKIGHAFVLSVRKRKPGIFSDAAADFRNRASLPEGCTAYIDHRQNQLNEILKAVKTRYVAGSDLFQTAALLWNRSLFFEVHEWLEEDWQQSKGDEKRCLQALIMAATVYELSCYQRTTPARKLAAKALVQIKATRRIFPEPFQPDALAQALSCPESNCPIFPIKIKVRKH